MGFDKLLSFFNKNLPNINEELFDVPYVVAQHIFFDMNFLIYNSINELEEEINKIIMIIYGVSYTNINIINEKLKNIFNGYHWKELNINMDEILDGDNIDEIIDNLKKTLDKYSTDLLINHLYNNLNHHIIRTHNLQFIKSINLFFDGIPTYSKILEQRRRRMKTYLDAKNRKKIFKKHFDKIINTVITEDEITYDYFDWVNNLYSFDKSLGPFSPVIINICTELEKKMTKSYNNNNISVYFNNSLIYGEADYKIFKYIIDNKIDGSIALHSCDSDFIFLLIWYQILSLSRNINLNIMLINYSNNKNERSFYNGKKMINLLMEKYAIINNINTTDGNNISINIIFDLLSLLILFGNDIMPPSYEIGPELSLKTIYESHYILYKESNYVINLNNECIVNFINLGKWLNAIKNKNSFSSVILNRFYKMPYNILVNIDNYNSLEEMVNEYFIKNNIEYKYMEISKGFYLEENGYQSLYNYVCYESSDMTEDIFNRPFKIFFDNLEEAYDKYKDISSNNVKDYLEMFVSLNQIFLYDFNLYTPYNILYFKDNIAPSIDNILKFINNNDMKLFQQKTLNSLLKSNLIKDEYFDPVSHHLFITPYLLDQHYELKFTNIRYVESLLNVISKNIKGIWFENNLISFNLKDIDPLIFIKLCSMLIKFYQNNFIDRFFIDNTKLICQK
jgi:hypothetical protein